MASTETPTSSPSSASPADAARALVTRLSRDEKLRVVSGADFWRTSALDEHGIPSVMLTDGPHGLRKQLGAGDHVGLSNSVPATCFPTAVTLGSSWDLELIEEVGAALGRETRAEEVGVLLGPGLNLKRHPAGGRSFEYFSEDPLLSGRAAAALVRGIQSEGVGACAKHYVVNNQEGHRMRLDTIVDERTLRELYLPAFEIVVTEASPWAVMSSYNLANGEHVGESRRLLTDVLRDEWGFAGLVVSDWLAVADRPASLHAGLDLEMPTSTGAWNARVVAALDSGELAEADLDLACARVVELALRVEAERAAHGGRGSSTTTPTTPWPVAPRRPAACLLTNDGTLPLAAARADRPDRRLRGAPPLPGRRQLAGAAHPARHRPRRDARPPGGRGRAARTCPATTRTPARRRRRCSPRPGARRPRRMPSSSSCGLPTVLESEGFDRTTLRLPEGHETLVEVVTAAHPARRRRPAQRRGARDRLGRTGPVPCSSATWAGRPAAAPWSTCSSVTSSRVAGSPRASRSPSPSCPRTSTSRPTPPRCSTGRRCTSATASTTRSRSRPRFCFGHGLGYTTFTVGDLAVAGSGTDLTATVLVRNTGERSGSRGRAALRPRRRLDGAPPRAGAEGVRQGAPAARRGARRCRCRSTGARSPSTTPRRRRGSVEAGRFEIRVGTSSRDIRAVTTVDIASDDVVTPVPAPAGAVATDAEFAVLLGRPIPAPRPLFPLHEDSTIDDLRQVVLGRPLRAVLLGVGQPHGRRRRRRPRNTGDVGCRARPDAAAGAGRRARAGRSRSVRSTRCCVSSTSPARRDGRTRS